ncbi:MAG: ion transporter [Clostridia bacterium]|nr:ion transporter [Clostridia bacterium]
MTYRKIKEEAANLLVKDDGDSLPSRIVDWSIMLMIFLSVLAIILESFAPVAVRYYKQFRSFETFTVIFFSVEYAARIWTADVMYPKARFPRLKYLFSFMALMDLLAILPWYLPFFSADLRFLRVLRMMRLFRLTRVVKLGRYLTALQSIKRVIRLSASRLIAAVTLCLVMMLLSAIVIYTVESTVQPEQFPNVLASLWWAVMTLTTVGYGDVYPITGIGRFFAGIISLVGIGIIAIPTGIIAAGFTTVMPKEEKEEIEEIEKEIESEEGIEEPKLEYCPFCGKKLPH